MMVLILLLLRLAKSFLVMRSSVIRGSARRPNELPGKPPCGRGSQSNGQSKKVGAAPFSFSVCGCIFGSLVWEANNFTALIVNWIKAKLLIFASTAV